MFLNLWCHLLFRSPLNSEQMLKWFYKRLWTGFHSKETRVLSLLTWNTIDVQIKRKLKLFCSFNVCSQARGKHRQPIQSLSVWLQFRPLQRSGGQHRCVRWSGQKGRQDRVNLSWQNLRGQRAGAPPPRWAPDTETVRGLCFHHWSPTWCLSNGADVGIRLIIENYSINELVDQ